MALLVHGIEVRADGAEILRTLKRAKTAGDFLLHLGHADGALAQVVGKQHAQIRHETQHLGGMLAHTADEIERHGLFNPAAALGLPRGPRITGLSLGQNRLVVRKNPPYPPFAQRCLIAPSRRLAVVTGADQKVDHAFGPSLAGGFAQKHQFAQ